MDLGSPMIDEYRTDDEGSDWANVQEIGAAMPLIHVPPGGGNNGGGQLHGGADDDDDDDDDDWIPCASDGDTRVSEFCVLCVVKSSDQRRRIPPKTLRALQGMEELLYQAADTRMDVKRDKLHDLYNCYIRAHMPQELQQDWTLQSIENHLNLRHSTQITKRIRMRVLDWVGPYFDTIEKFAFVRRRGRRGFKHMRPHMKVCAHVLDVAKFMASLDKVA